MKRDGLFNVKMGAYDGAEVCELVGTFSLDKISVEYHENSIGLYHDHNLSVFKNSTWKNKKELRKNIFNINLKVVNYLNITLNLNDGSLDLATNQKVLFSTLTNGLTTLLILLSTRQHLLKNGFLNNSFDEKIFQESLLIR